MVRILAVLHVLSVVIMMFALCLLFPLAWSFFLGDAAQTAYDEAIALTAISGVLIWLMTRKKRRELQPRDGFLLVLYVPRRNAALSLRRRTSLSGRPR